jgi:hypothetical protein
MSVQTNHYIILGVRLPYKSLEYEAVEKFTDSAWKPKRSGFLVLFDGMNGEYIVAGRVRAATGCESEGFGEGAENMVEVPLPSNDECWEIRKEIEKNLGIEIPQGIKLIAVTHWR